MENITIQNFKGIDLVLEARTYIVVDMSATILNCVYVVYDLFLLQCSLEGLCLECSESSQEICFHPCAGLSLDLFSGRIMFFGSGNFSSVTLISSLFASHTLDSDPLPTPHPDWSSERLFSPIFCDFLFALLPQ